MRALSRSAAVEVTAGVTGLEWFLLAALRGLVTGWSRHGSGCDGVVNCVLSVDLCRCLEVTESLDWCRATLCMARVCRDAGLQPVMYVILRVSGYSISAHGCKNGRIAGSAVCAQQLTG